jgi:hypothetical protein
MLRNGPGGEGGRRPRYIQHGPQPYALPQMSLVHTCTCGRLGHAQDPCRALAATDVLEVETCQSQRLADVMYMLAVLLRKLHVLGHSGARQEVPELRMDVGGEGQRRTDNLGLRRRR